MNGRRFRLQKNGVARFRSDQIRTVASMFQGLGRSLQKQSKWAAALLAVGSGVGVAACGASIQAVYEGDVRFEHCMALDGQPDVKLHIRRACWREWISFYTYGQTRDRVRHAQKRIRQLSGVSEFLTDPAAGGGDPGQELGGAGGAAAASTQTRPSPTVGTVTPSKARCVDDCEAMREDCRRQCRTVGCEKSCAMVFRSCIADCVH
jgi:hypothetical protein